MRSSTRVLLIALLGATLSACVNTSLVDKWKDPAYAGPVVHKVLVVGVQHDQGRRRVWEDAMVAALAHRGLQAEASYQIFPDQAPNPEALTAMANRDGFDGVIATHLVTASQHIESYPGWGPGWGYPGWGWAYGWPGPRWGWAPWGGPPGGYIESQYRVDYQTDIFTVDAAGGKLVWSGVTRSIDPSSIAHVTDEISHVLIPQLGRDGIVTAPKKS
jgi:hypothetical protein